MLANALPRFVLIHAPLVGPMTWSLVGAVLRKNGYAVTLPVLEGTWRPDKPFWQQHAEAVADAVAVSIASVLAEGQESGLQVEDAGSGLAPLVLVAHSGAGPLLPAVSDRLGRPAAAQILVDAMFPEDGKSRFELMENHQAALEFRHSAVNGMLPVWTEEDLRDDITDDAVLRGFVEELRPLPLVVYEEKIPVSAGWPECPAAYLRFGKNPAYDAACERARQAGFLIEQMEGQHFEMLEHPRRVAQELVNLARRMGIPVREGLLHA